MMRVSITSYINKRGVRGPWKLDNIPSMKFRYIMIVPAMAELNYLPNFLTSVAGQKLFDLNELLVIIVINNGESPDKELYFNNCETQSYLENSTWPFSLRYVDAFSADFQLPEKYAGVGLARKIGTDISLPWIIDDGLYFYCDADCLISPDYFSNIISNYKKIAWPASVVGFSHQLSGNQKMDGAIRQYEQILIGTAEKLKDAGSVYAYPAIGSAIVFTPATYIAVGGMNKKKATEDFYFLQEIAKYRGIYWNREELVYPSSRAEKRVHIGTGARMVQVKNGSLDILSLKYRDISFDILAKWLKLAQGSYYLEVNELLNKSRDIHIDLPLFLRDIRIMQVWRQLQQSASSPVYFSQQFQRWFDGLKTIRFLRYFSINGR